jgi:hypothetical protein
MLGQCMGWATSTRVAKVVSDAPVQTPNEAYGHRQARPRHAGASAHQAGERTALACLMKPLTESRSHTGQHPSARLHANSFYGRLFLAGSALRMSWQRTPTFGAIHAHATLLGHKS